MVEAATAVSAECQRWQAAARTRVYPADSDGLSAALASAVAGMMIDLGANVHCTASGTPRRFIASGRRGASADKIYLCGPRSAVLQSGMEAHPADDGGMSTNYVLWLNDSHWWVIDGFTVRTANKGVLGPDQRVEPIVALKATTLWAAYQHFEEKTKGSIEVGKLADFVVVSGNPSCAR